jgi:hypothetical protein
MIQSFPIQIYSDTIKEQPNKKQERVPPLVSPDTRYNVISKLKKRIMISRMIQATKENFG